MLLASVYILPIKECWIDKGLILFLWFGEDWCSARLIFFKTVLKNSFPERSHIERIVVNWTLAYVLSSIPQTQHGSYKRHLRSPWICNGFDHFQNTNDNLNRSVWSNLENMNVLKILFVLRFFENILLILRHHQLFQYVHFRFMLSAQSRSSKGF